jgi:hypothetical protein
MEMLMRGSIRTLFAGSLALILFGCGSLELYRLADNHKHEISSLALLPLIVGDEQGRIRSVGEAEYHEFVEYFDSRFFTDFQDRVQLPDSVDLLLPGRDFSLLVHNGMDYHAVASELGVDSVLAIHLVRYNEIKPGMKGAQVVGAVVSTVLLGGYVVENEVVEYEIQFAYLDVEQVGETLVFEYFGESFPSIETQREFFVDSIIQYLDVNFPLSTDYQPRYRD